MKKIYIIVEAGINHNGSPYILSISPKFYNQGTNHENNI